MRPPVKSVSLHVKSVLPPLQSAPPPVPSELRPAQSVLPGLESVLLRLQSVLPTMRTEPTRLPRVHPGKKSAAPAAGMLPRRNQSEKTGPIPGNNWLQSLLRSVQSVRLQTAPALGSCVTKAPASSTKRPTSVTEQCVGSSAFGCPSSVQFSGKGVQNSGHSLVAGARSGWLKQVVRRCIPGEALIPHNRYRPHSIRVLRRSCRCNFDFWPPRFLGEFHLWHTRRIIAAPIGRAQPIGNEQGIEPMRSNHSASSSVAGNGVLARPGRVRSRSHCVDQYPLARIRTHHSDG